MVLISTLKSLKDREISFLAVLEIIISVGLYWGIAVYYNTYWHLVLSIAIAPLFLLQSKELIQFSLKKFDSYSKSNFSKNLFIFMSIILPLLSILNIFYFKVNNTIFWILSLLVLSLWIILIISNIYIFIINTKLKIQKKLELSFVASSLYFPFIVIIVSVLNSLRAKIIGTILNLQYGYHNFVSNWFKWTFVIDMKVMPEIIAGIESEPSNFNHLKASILLKAIQANKIQYDKILKNYDINTSLPYKFSSLTELIGIYFFTLFYRLSIKSTFWFYIPLLFVVKSPNLDTSEHIGKFLSELYQTTWVKVRGLLALTTIISFIITHFNFYSFEKLNSPFSSIIALLYFDFSSLEMWKISQLLISLLTIILIVYANHIRVPNVSNNIPLLKNIHVKIIFYLNIVRNWLSLFYILSAFIFLATYFKVWQYEYIPNFLNSFFTILLKYVQYVPFN